MDVRFMNKGSFVGVSQERQGSLITELFTEKAEKATLGKYLYK